MEIQAVGIDLGGTWLRLRAIDSAGKIVRSYQEHAPPLKELSHRLRQLWRQWKIHPRHLHLASRGVWTAHERKHLEKSLHGLAHHITVISDVEAAWLGAFQWRESGILVIAGTGSIAFGRHQERSARAGGLGPYLGDEGSGFWIGREWLKRQGASPPGMVKTLEFLHPLSSPVREIAGLTPKVLLQSQRGNRLARAIIAEAQTHLAQAAFDTAHQLRWRGPLRISWAGGLLDHAAFRIGFFQALRRKGRSHKMKIHFIEPQRDPINALLYDETTAP